MKPFIHAKTSARKYGGNPGDYIELHNFFDSTKQAIASMAHRAILHNAWGIFLAEKLFGYPFEKIQVLAQKHNWSEEEVKDIMSLIDLSRTGSSPNIMNSDGKQVSVRDVGEDHVLEDVGKIPSLSECLKDLPISPLLGGNKKITKILTFGPGDIID